MEIEINNFDELIAIFKDNKEEGNQTVISGQYRNSRGTGNLYVTDLIKIRNGLIQNVISYFKVEGVGFSNLTTRMGEVRFNPQGEPRDNDINAIFLVQARRFPTPAWAKGIKKRKATKRRGSKRRGSTRKRRGSRK